MAVKDHTPISWVCDSAMSSLVFIVHALFRLQIFRFCYMTQYNVWPWVSGPRKCQCCQSLLQQEGVMLILSQDFVKHPLVSCMFSCTTFLYELLFVTFFCDKNHGAPLDQLLGLLFNLFTFSGAATSGLFDSFAVTLCCLP